MPLVEISFLLLSSEPLRLNVAQFGLSASADLSFPSFVLSPSVRGGGYTGRTRTLGNTAFRKIPGAAGWMGEAWMGDM